MAELVENDRLTGPLVPAPGITDLPADFPLIKSEGVKVRRERAGTAALLSPADYAIVNQSPTGFTVRLNAGALAGDRYWIFSRLPSERRRAHGFGGAVRTPTLEGDAEEFQGQLQEHRRDLDRGVAAPIGEPGLELPPAAARADRLAGFDQAGALVGSTRTLTQFDADMQFARETSEALAAALLRTAVFNSRADAVASLIADSFGAVQTLGWAVPGDGGGATYVRAAGEPGHAGKFQSDDGAWWEIAVDTLFPEQFGAVALDATEVVDATGFVTVTYPTAHDATAAVVAWIEAACLLGRPARARDRWYGLNQARPLVIRALDLDNFAYTDLTPDGADDRTPLKLAPAVAGRGAVRIGRQVRGDRAGDGSRGGMNGPCALHVAGVPLVTIGAEVFGGGIGCGIIVDDASVVTCDSAYAHDLRYLHTDQTDDSVQGVWFRNCRSVAGLVRVRRLGRTDWTHAERTRFSRGVAFSNCNSVSLKCFVDDTDQAVDVTGGGGNDAVDFAGSVINRAFTNGIKFANSAVGCNLNGVQINQAGLQAVLVSGPSEVIANLTRDIQVSGAVIRNTGTNGYWKAQGAEPRCVGIDRNGGSPPLNGYPKAVVVHGVKGFNDQGSATFSVVGTGAAAVLRLTAGIPLQTGVRCRISSQGATDYWLIEIPDTLDVRLAASHNAALDGVAVDPTGFSGQLTLQQDGDWGVWSNLAAHDPTGPIERFGCTFTGMRLGAANDDVKPLRVDAAGPTQPIGNDVTAGVVITYSDPGGLDPHNLLDHVTGVFGPWPRDGWVEVAPAIIADSVAGGARQYSWQHSPDGATGWTTDPQSTDRTDAGGQSIKVGHTHSFYARQGRYGRAVFYQNRGGPLDITPVAMRVRYMDRD